MKASTEEIIEIVKKRAKNSSTITETSHLYEDLWISTSDFEEIAYEIQERFGESFSAEDFRNIRLRCFDNMDKAGFDQVPAGSTFSARENFEGLVRYSMEHISTEHTMGFMHTTWERVAEGWLHHHDTCAENIKEAIKK